MKIAILSFHSGKHYRGAETWAENLKKRFPGIQIFSGWESYNPLLWAKADIIIPTNGRLQVLLARLLCKKIVVFGHSGPGADDKWNLWCSPDVFVAFSTPQSIWANKFKLPWTAVTVIPHAVDTQFFAPDHKIKKTVDVLCVAANSPDKRVDLVSQAAGNLSLKVVGSGQPVQVPYSRMPAVYNQAKVFCFVPKAHEAFGLVYLEAMACNLPVVAPADPVRTEMIGAAGVLVTDPENSSELATALEKALHKNWGNTPREQAQKFAWSKTIKAYQQLFISWETRPV